MAILGQNLAKKRTFSEIGPKKVTQKNRVRCLGRGRLGSIGEASRVQFVEILRGSDPRNGLSRSDRGSVQLQIGVSQSLGWQPNQSFGCGPMASSMTDFGSSTLVSRARLRLISMIFALALAAAGPFGQRDRIPKSPPLESDLLCLALRILGLPHGVK